MHPQYRSKAYRNTEYSNDDSLAQQVEHIPFKDGVLGSNPRRITENKRKIKQIPDNQTLSGISFFWQVAENSCFKHIVGVQIVVHKSSRKKSHDLAFFSLIHSVLRSTTLEENT